MHLPNHKIQYQILSHPQDEANTLSSVGYGYIILSRSIIDSEIWSKPPLYLKVWLLLLLKAQHSNYKNLKRGQLFTSIPEIIERCVWFVGARKVKPTKDQIFQILAWLRNPCGDSHGRPSKATMITSTKATHGMLIDISNYEYYQNPKNYEGNDESNNEMFSKATRKQRHPDNINKNDKNSKNDKNVEAELPPSINNHKSLKKFAVPSQKDVIDTFLQKGGTVEMAEKFFSDHSATGWMKNGQLITDFQYMVSNYIKHWNKFSNEQKKKTEVDFKANKNNWI